MRRRPALNPGGSQLNTSDGHIWPTALLWHRNMLQQPTRDSSNVWAREREDLFLVPLVWWNITSHKAQLSHASTTAPPLLVIWIVLSQAPALRSYRAVKDKAQVYHYTRGLWLQQGELKSQSTLYDGMYAPRSSDDLKLLSFKKKKNFKVHRLQSSSRLTIIISRVVENREQRREPAACSWGHDQCAEQLWNSFSASYTYWCYPSNSERERNYIKTSCVYKKQSTLSTATKDSWGVEGQQNS